MIVPVYQCENKEQISLTIFHTLTSYHIQSKKKLLSVYTNVQMTRGASILFQIHHKY